MKTAVINSRRGLSYCCGKRNEFLWLIGVRGIPVVYVFDYYTQITQNKFGLYGVRWRGAADAPHFVCSASSCSALPP